MAAAMDTSATDGAKGQVQHRPHLPACRCCLEHSCSSLQCIHNTWLLPVHALLTHCMTCLHLQEGLTSADYYFDSYAHHG